jgi:hypothetical protein
MPKRMEFQRLFSVDSGYSRVLLHMNVKNTRAALFGSVALLFVAACGTNEQDPNHRVAFYRNGQLESELRRDVGTPTQERTMWSQVH